MYPIQNTGCNRLFMPRSYHVVGKQTVTPLNFPRSANESCCASVMGYHWHILQNIVIMNEMHCISGKIQLLFKRILPRVQAALSIPYFRMSWLMWTHISLLQDFMRFGGKTFCSLFQRSPSYMCEIIHQINVIHTQETAAFGQCHIWYIAVFVESLLSMSNLFRLPKAYDWYSWTQNLLRN